jgi:hypothetical protein
MATTTNYGWTTPDDTALVKDGAAAIRTLGSSVDTTTKNLNPETTLGDISYRSSTANVKTRLGLGTAGQILQVNSGATAPEWATPAASGGTTLISETVASALSSLSFSSLGSYKQLLLVWHGITHSAGSSTFVIRFNTDSGSNYIQQALWYGGGFDVSVGTGTSINNSGMAAFGVGCTGGGNQAASGWLTIDNYTSSTKTKQYNLFNLFRNAAADGAGVARGGFTSGFYNSQTAITSIDIVRTAGGATFSNDSNTTIRLYGLT